MLCGVNMAEGIESIKPVTESGGVYPMMAPGKNRNYGNDFITLELINSIVEDIKKRWGMS